MGMSKEEIKELVEYGRVNGTKAYTKHILKNYIFNADKFSSFAAKFFKYVQTMSYFGISGYVGFKAICFAYERLGTEKFILMFISGYLTFKGYEVAKKWF